MTRRRLNRHIDLNDFRHTNIYDCFRVNGSWADRADENFQDNYSIRVFGTANVGHVGFTNLQVGGMVILGNEECFVIQRWYARTDARTTEIFMQWANNVNLILQVGTRLWWNLSLFELLERRPRYTDQQVVRPTFDPMPVVIHPRQDISVRVDAFSRIGHRMWEEQYRPDFIPRVWIHLEGVIAPWAMVQPYFDDMIAQTKANDDRAAQFVLRHITDDSSEEERSQLQALADGFLEQRHRQ